MVDQHQLKTANDIGQLQADVRTIKHDVANISAKQDAMYQLIHQTNMKQARGLGFFAGAAFIVSGAAGILIAFAKAIFGGGA